MNRLFAIFLIAGCATWTGANAQNDHKAEPPVQCPATAQDLAVETLYGDWQAGFDGLPAAFAIHLAKHPDYVGVKGTISRGTSVAQLAGDIDDAGQLSMDESQDGHSISGIWLGMLQPGSCGKQFKGTWRNVADDSMHPFVLNKTGSEP